MTDRVDIQALCWPESQLDELIARLSRESGMAGSNSADSSSPAVSAAEDTETLNDRITAGANYVGVEAVRAEGLPYGDFERFLMDAAPAVIRLPKSLGGGFLGLLKKRGSGLVALAPDLSCHHMSPEEMRSAVCLSLEDGVSADVERLISRSKIPERDHTRVRSALIAERLAATQVDGVWLLRPHPGAPFWFQLRRTGLTRPIAGLIGTYAVGYLLGIFGWWLIGRSILEGHLDWGWFVAWALSLLAMLPLRTLTGWYQGLVAIGCGGLLKRRLIHGALSLEPEQMRTQGVGQFLSRVIESEEVESLALTTGFIGLLAIMELLSAFIILGTGAGGLLEAGLFAVWIVVALVIGLRHWRNCVAWTSARTDMTDDLVEKMIGNQTRLVQQRRDQWHSGEDGSSERYLGISRQMDRTGVLVASLIPQGWMIVGLLGLVPALMGYATPGRLAVGIGGILLASGALQRLVGGLVSLGAAAIAWQQVSQLYRAAADCEAKTRVLALESPASSKNGRLAAPALSLHDVRYRYPNKNQAVLDGVDMQIAAGDRILLEGGSGAGKSTFAALLAGLRVPDSGVLLLRGLDRRTLGASQWRRRVALAPQFHENHVLTESFAFNLLMGRCWPPAPQDLVEAEEVCQELGLGELLKRMPAGLQQIVGDGAWQLSHGERSRLFIARALLQKSDLTILDESLAALDPENFARALTCAWKRSNTLLVIAHP